MSTRAIVEFVYDAPKACDHCNSSGADASIYVHYDGYPDINSGGLADTLIEFFKETSKLPNKRWNDPLHLSAKFLVFCLLQNTNAEDLQKLNFSGICPTNCVHGDIEFIYRVDCSKAQTGQFNEAVVLPVVSWAHAKNGVASSPYTDIEVERLIFES